MQLTSSSRTGHFVCTWLLYMNRNYSLGHCALASIGFGSHFSLIDSQQNRILSCQFLTKLSVRLLPIFAQIIHKYPTFLEKELLKKPKLLYVYV
jgi:hypothetical protein